MKMLPLKPKLPGDPTELLQSKSNILSDTRVACQNTVKGLTGKAKVAGCLGHGQTEGRENRFSENDSGMINLAYLVIQTTGSISFRCVTQFAI